jgi:ABC-2 type transport system permease protein
MTQVAAPREDLWQQSATKAPSGRPFWLPAGSLCVRELVRFFRQRTRIIGALGQPIMFWILFGAGLGGTFRAPAWAPAEMSYQEYFLPGVVVLIVMFTAIFSTISIIEDRREGFLQGVLVAPISRSSLVLGKVGGGTAIAIVQAALFLAIGPALWVVGLGPHMHLDLSVWTAIGLGAFLVLLSFTLTALGYVIAWPMESTQGFHAIMSVFLMPMWLLSGAFFPVPDSGWLAWMMRLNPLTYGVAGLQRFLFAPSNFGQDQSLLMHVLGRAKGPPSLAACVVVTALFGAVCFLIAVYLTSRRSTRDAR